MKIEKEHQHSTLMNKSKIELANYIMTLEHNNNVLHDTIDTQAENFKELLNKYFEKTKLVFTKIMEHTCDNLCKYPTQATEQEELDNICHECEIGKFICEVLKLL